MLLLLSENIFAYTSEGNGTCNCNGCTDCQNALSNNTNCSVLVKLTEDIIDHAGTCINNPENFNNKVFDCQGHRIDGDNTGTDYGIYLYNKVNDTIKNCIITQFYNGIYISAYGYHIIANNTINSNTESGVRIEANYNLLANNTANSNVYGVYLTSAPYNILEGNTLILNTAYGIFLYYSAYNNISKNTANSNTLCGIYLFGSPRCNIVNNTAISNKYGLYLTYYSDYNNILSNNFSGNQIGFVTSHTDPNGVYYSLGNSGNTLRENEISNNGNGIYSIGSSSTINWNRVCGNGNLDFNSTNWQSSSGDNNTCDKPQIWNDYLTTGCTYSCTTKTDYICNCSNCDDCEERIIDQNCREIRLSTDISSYTGTCIDNPENFNNKIFDCQGHKIDGDDLEIDYGIYLSAKDNNTIKNCVITDFYHGIFLNFSSNITLSNINTSSHTQYGVFLLHSIGNLLANLTANSNSQNGVYMRSSSQNTLVDLTANSNSQNGVYLYNSVNNTLFTITANSNSQNGIYLYNSSHNQLSNSTVSLNSYGLYLLYSSNFNNISNNRFFNNTNNGITTSNCDTSLWCPGGNTNNTLQGNRILNNNIGIYSKSSSSTINSNLVCENSNLDFNSIDWQLSFGDDNTCNRPDGWNDTGAIGCTYHCPCYCSSCSSCQEKLNDTSCNMVYLTSNILNSPSTCINNPENFINKTFDCQQYIIDGNGLNYGIYLNGKSWNTIKNCMVTGFYNGIYLFNSSNNTLLYNTVNSNNYTGIFLSYSSGNTFSGITANNNKQHGFYADASSTNNKINSNTFCYNNGTVDSYDIYNTDSNFGDDNICDSFYGWEDESSFLGCKHTCDGRVRYRLLLQIGWNLISFPVDI
ncbi:MAG: NosD domain-containing protein [Candidatus Altiarchaeota archaeon]